MASHAPGAVVEPRDVADILDNIASLMANFRDCDIALQNALSSLTRAPTEPLNMRALQHVDLLTQSHDDLSKLLFALGPCLRGETVTRQDLQSALRLRSLQDELVAVDDANGKRPEVNAGDVSLF